MNAAAWISLAGLAVVVLAHVVASAYKMGKQDQRLTTLENLTSGGIDQGLAIARLEVQVGHVVTKVDGMDKKIDERLGFLQEPATYSRPARARPSK